MLATNDQVPDTALESWCGQQWRVANVEGGGEAETADAGHSLCSDWRLVIKLEDGVGVVSLNSEVMPAAEDDGKAGDELELDTGDGEHDMDESIVDGDGDMVRDTHGTSPGAGMKIQQS